MFISGAILLLTALLQSASPSRGSSPNDVYQKVFSDYNAKVLPISRKGEKIRLEMSLEPLFIRDLDEEKEILSLDAWIYMKWNDSHLTWNPSSYGGLDHLILPSNEVWKPDITVYSSSPMKELVPQVFTNVIVNYTGSVLWVPPCTISSRCNLDYSDYPEDEHECTIKLGSWTFGSLSLDVQIRKSEEFLSNFHDDNPHWSLQKMSVIKNDKYYDCCPNEYYTTVEYTISLKRKAASEAFISEAVSIFAVFLALLMFWLPPNSTHKIILGAMAEVLLGLEALYIGGTLESPGAITRCTDTIYPLMCLIGVLLIIEVILINLSAISSTHRAPKWILSAANGFCRPLRMCISRSQQKTDGELIATNSEEEWKLVAMVFDRVFFFIAFIIVVLFHKVL